MEKDMKISLLLDFYGSLLTQKQARAIRLYYDEDLSLSEVAQDLSISRQGARDIIARGCEFLVSCEDSLGLLSEFTRLKGGLKSIKDRAGKINELSNDMKIRELAVEIIEAVSTLEET